MRRRFRRWFGVGFAVLFLGLPSVRAQEKAPVAPLSPSAAQPQPAQEVKPPCLEPPPVVRWEDYDGPLRKTVGVFARALERKSVHAPHYKPGLLLCSLGTKDKFILFTQDSFSFAAFLSAGFNAGLDQASDRDPTFRQGTLGYGRRYAASFTDQTSSKFFRDFAYPTLFREDPRYYRMAHGNVGKRLLHAVAHSVVAYRENGSRMFNSSEWLGTTTSVILSNAYHPGNERGVVPVARSVGLTVLQDAGFDVLREFWPEIARKLNLPFRGSNAERAQPELPANK